jgi:hypothetical protein
MSILLALICCLIFFILRQVQILQFCKILNLFDYFEGRDEHSIYLFFYNRTPKIFIQKIPFDNNNKYCSI